MFLVIIILSICVRRSKLNFSINEITNFEDLILIYKLNRHVYKADLSSKVLLSFIALKIYRSVSLFVSMCINTVDNNILYKLDLPLIKLSKTSFAL